MVALSVIGALFVFWLLPERWRWQWLIGTSILGFALMSLPGCLYALMLLCATRAMLYFQRLLIVGLLVQLLLVKIFFPVLPLGVSFLTFFLIHYVVDFHKSKIVDKSMSAFFGRALFIPLLTAGPIERFQHFVSGRTQTPLWTDAGWRLILGLVQKLVFADWFCVHMLNGWDGEVLAMYGLELAPINLWGVLVCLFVQLYFDFAGYSNIAIGLSALFGFAVADNFHFPLLATSPAEFWKRWHISLSSWCQEYVYMPMLGLSRNPYLGIMSTFLVMGMWHAISIHWLCWGLCHAVALMIHLRWRRFSRSFSFVKTRFWSVLSWFGLMLFLATTGVFTQLHTHAPITTSGLLILRMFGAQ